MNKTITILAMLLCLLGLTGCSQIDPNALVQEVETIASQIDVEAIVTGAIENIDWEELKSYAQQGYDALTEKYPALKQENIRQFVKENGLNLMKEYLRSSDASMQENARKLGEIIKILYPELTEEVDTVIGE